MRRLALLTTLMAVLAATPAGAQQQQRPPITAASAIVVEATSGEVVFKHQPDVRRQIASTTKLMTALLALEAGDGVKEIVPASRYRAAAA